MRRYDPSITPTPFGPERAAAIWAQRGMEHSLERSDMTAGEHAYVHRLWLTMPGSACWMSAFYKILNGRVTRG